jgi:hypothetical protein
MLRHCRHCRRHRMTRKEIELGNSQPQHACAAADAAYKLCFDNNSKNLTTTLKAPLHTPAATTAGTLQGARGSSRHPAVGVWRCRHKVTDSQH